MLVLVGAGVDGAGDVSVLVVGSLLTVVGGAGATGALVVALLGEDEVVVTAADVVDEVDGDVPPPPCVRSTISKITSASRMATSAAKPIRAARVRYHGVDSGSGWP